MNHTCNAKLYDCQHCSLYAQCLTVPVPCDDPARPVTLGEYLQVKKFTKYNPAPKSHAYNVLADELAHK